LRKKSLKNLLKADYNGKKIVSFGNPIYKAPFFLNGTLQVFLMVIITHTSVIVENFIKILIVTDPLYSLLIYQFITQYTGKRIPVCPISLI